MIKEAMQFLKDNIKTGKTLDFHGRSFSVEDLKLIPNKFTEPTPNVLTVNTLTGFCDYINSKIDTLEGAFIHVENYNTVSLRSALFGDQLQRKEWLCATTDKILNDGFRFGSFMSIPDFIIQVQSYFSDTEDIQKILTLVSNIKAEQGQSYADNGFAQSVTAKRSTGSSMVDQTAVPNPVTLKPYRTFLEIDQPESSFVFRLSSGGEGEPPKCALFEASGGAWKLDAIQKIRVWIDQHSEILTIIA